MRILRGLLQAFTYLATLGFSLTGCFLIVTMLNHHRVLPGWWALFSLFCYILVTLGSILLNGYSIRFSRRVANYVFPRPKNEDSP
jgi:hypothetical protein